MKLLKLLSRKKQVYCYSLFFLLLLSGCSKVLHWSRAEPQFYAVDSARVDSTMLAMIQPYSNTLWAEMNEVIGENAQVLNKEKPEGTLNNWIADIMKVEAEKFTGTQVDFAVCNYGGIRINTIPEGPLTLGRIYEVMPFDNLLVIMELTGTQLEPFIHHMAMEGGWPSSKELRYTIADNNAVAITINNKPFDRLRTYRMVLPDYVANGGGSGDLLKSLPRQTLSYLMRDAMIANVRNLTASGQSIAVVKDGRIKLVGAN